MNTSFVLRAGARGYNKLRSTGPLASYISGHPEAVLLRHSSFNFGSYQTGHAGFGRMRVFGDEVFSGPGCGYNMHRHHNFIICAFVLEGELAHINTVGNIDRLTPGDYYVFSAGSGGKHCEVNLRSDDMHAIYIWFLPDQLLLPPSYHRNHFDALANRNQLVTLVGNADGALRVSQDVRVSRLSSDTAMALDYTPQSAEHGVYVFVLDGEVHCNDVSLARRDSNGIWGAKRIKLQTGPQETDLMLVETAP
ncbi:MAG: pirin family protein [Solidesulfovibrio sp. DCME]|uniref:pirin family protein n=1 Tax=Solidesulfovibrio sp. DCME TaxID=3447380 RepID=UPI003D0B6D29